MFTTVPLRTKIEHNFNRPIQADTHIAKLSAFPGILNNSNTLKRRKMQSIVLSVTFTAPKQQFENYIFGTTNDKFSGEAYILT